MTTRLLVPVSLLLILALVPLNAQIIHEQGNFYRKGFKKYDEHSTASKNQYDTLKYQALEKISDDVLVNTDCGEYGSNQFNTDVAKTDLGGGMAIWLDERTGLRRIDAQLLDSSGNRIGNVIRISDRYNSWNSQPHIIFNEVTREYVVTWADDGINIAIQRLTESGAKIGSNSIINDLSILNTNNPSIAVGPLGNMMATWVSEGLYYESNQIICRMLDKRGTPKGNSFRVMNAPTDHISSLGWQKSIASDSLGRFLLVWSSHVNNRSRIVVQAVDSSGVLIGSNTIVSDPADTITHYFPTITSLKGGEYLLVWEKEAGNVAGRVYSIDAGFLSPQLNVSNKRDGWFTIGVNSNSTDKFIVTYSGWTMNGAANAAIILSRTGIVIDSIHTMPEPYFNSTWSYPNPSVIRNNSFFLGYGGYRRNDADAVVQKIGLANLISGPVIKLSDDACSSQQQNPVTAVNQHGESIIVWEDRKTSTPSLWAQLYDRKNDPIGPNFRVSSSSLSQWVSRASVIADADGNFIVSFSGGAYDYKDLFLQKILRSGELAGGNINLTNNPYAYNGYDSRLQTDVNGDLHVVWFSIGTTYSQVIYQTFNRNLSPLTVKKQLLNASTKSIRWMFDAAFNEHSDLLLLWSDMESKYTEHAGGLKAMKFNSEGTSISDTIIINQLPDTRWYMSAACAMDNEQNIVVTFSDMSYVNYDGKITFSRIYQDPSLSKRYTTDVYDTRPVIRIPEFKNQKGLVTWYVSGSIRGLLIDDNFGTLQPLQLRMYPYVYSSFYDAYPNYNTALNGDTLLLTYADVIDQERGYDIYASRMRLSNFDFNPSFIKDSVSVEATTAPYPNPNSAIVTMAYQIKMPMNVEISVYNILGQKITTLINTFTQIGTHYITFDTRTVPSGVYFFHYRGANSYTRKFIVTR